MGIDALRDGRWLTAERLRGYLLLFALFNLATLAVLLATSRAGIDRNGYLLGTDFLAFWSVGQMLGEGGNPYDHHALIEAQRAIYAGHSGFTAFFYPPVFLPFAWPLGLGGYFSALAIWLLATGALFVLAVRRWLPHIPLTRLALAVLAFPPVLLTITHGQTSFLVAALLGGGCWLVAHGRKALGGVLLGLAVIKPQFGLLVPVLLLASREWRVIAAACGSALVLALIATLAFGITLWSDWFAASAHAQDAMNGGAIGFAKMMSPFAAMRLIGIGTGLAYAVQALVLLVCAGFVCRLGWKAGFTQESAATMLCGSLLATPFVLDYDLLLTAFPLAVIANGQARPWERLIAVSAFALGAFARPLALTSGIAIAPIVLGALFWALVRRVAADARQQKGAA